MTSEQRDRLKRELLAQFVAVSDDIARFGSSFVSNKHEPEHLWKFSVDVRNDLSERLGSLKDAERYESELGEVAER